MRYVNLDIGDTLARFTSHVLDMCEANADRLNMIECPMCYSTGHDIDLPYCERDAWDAEEEEVLEPLGFLSIYYQKVHNPSAEDYRARQLMPLEVYESKAGMSLMRAYDLNAGFVKSFRLDAVQRVLIRNQNLSDDEWGLQDITFHGRGAL